MVAEDGPHSQKESTMMMTKTLALCATALLATGCAFAPVDRPAAAKHTPQAKTWQVKSKDVPAVLDAAKAAFESAGYETASITPELGELKSKGRPVSIPDVCDCGTWNGTVIGGSAQSAVTATYKLQSTDEGILQLNHLCATQFRGRNIYGMVTRREAYACASRGQIETDLSQRIEGILRARNISFN